MDVKSLRSLKPELESFLTRHLPLFGRRLFLPESWIADRPRCAAAGVQADVTFRTKPELAAGMIEQALRDGVPFRWVTGDSAYGVSPSFLQALRLLEKWYVVDVTSEVRAWSSPPKMRFTRDASAGTDDAARPSRSDTL